MLLEIFAGMNDLDAIAYVTLIIVGLIIISSGWRTFKVV
jgi:hypothetical protein